MLRPKQWTKNLLALAAWVFTASYTSGPKTVQVLLAILCLCLASSATYALNDVLDAEADQNHPTKKNRPIASGEVSSKVGILIAVGCLVGAFVVAWLLGRSTVLALGFFLGIHLLYNAFLKKIAIADVLFIGIAFVQRAALGAIAINVKISAWLLFVTGTLALLIGFAKRRQEFSIPDIQEAETRIALKGYSQPLLDYLVVFSATLATLSYGIYVIESDTARAHPSLILTAPFVIFGILRYLSLVFGRNEGGEPESLILKDIPLLVTIALFGVMSVACLSGLSLPFLLSPSK
ncbi:MAG: UbiA prenyltransferase family protein [Armatimonadetes bacterium]|nr:UbiA prenyltransferase family protein [Armatimonadota bacterium]